MLALSGPCQRYITKEKASCAIIFLHGYGANGDDLIGLASYLKYALPEAAFYSPHAPHPCEVNPMGRQWFSLASYNPEAFLHSTEDQQAEYMQKACNQLVKGADDVAPTLKTFIMEVADAESLPLSKIALVGFSQGTMMALHVGLRLEETLGAIVGFSGALLDSEQLTQSITVRPPVLLIHGREDSVVPFSALSISEKALSQCSVNVTTHACPNMAHGIDEDGLSQAAAFLQKSRLAAAGLEQFS